MEVATLEPEQPQAETPTITASSQRKPHFTKENAKHYHALAVEARKLAKIEREQAAAKVKDIAELEPEQRYRLKRLARVREQLEQVDRLIDGCKDSKRLKELTDAQARLSVQEFALAGRATPGSHRPSKSPTTKPSSIEPSE